MTHQRAVPRRDCKPKISEMKMDIANHGADEKRLVNLIHGIITLAACACEMTVAAVLRLARAHRLNRGLELMIRNNWTKHFR